MKEDVKNVWVEALRSGEYKQAAGVLKTNEGFCCLGVLCDIHSKLTGQGRWNFVPTDGMNWYELVDDHSKRDGGILPDFAMEWAEMKSGTGDLSTSECLTHMNDSGKTFEEIADVIEQNWEKL